MLYYASTIVKPKEVIFLIDRDALRECARAALEPVKSHPYRETGWAYRHGWRTAALAIWLRGQLLPQETELDDVLYAAGLFHDCAKDDEADHAAAGSRRVVELLDGIELSGLLPAVTQAIYRHNKRQRDEYTAAEKILQDADIIDHFGTIEIWLNTSYSVLSGSGPEVSTAFYREGWQGMIDDLRGQFNYELSRRIFEDRISYNEEYIRRLAVESVGGVYDAQRIL